MGLGSSQSSSNKEPARNHANEYLQKVRVAQIEKAQFFVNKDCPKTGNMSLFPFAPWISKKLDWVYGQTIWTAQFTQIWCKFPTLGEIV